MPYIGTAISSASGDQRPKPYGAVHDIALLLMNSASMRFCSSIVLLDG